MPKNIVVCCDGTSNEVTGNLSNVLKLFRIAKKGGAQRVFYDPGVGTIANQSAWHRLMQKVSSVFGLATGAGLDDNILHAYRFLVSTYEDGDKIFLFGFSRGAYTVRALAGFIHAVGLLHPDQLNLCSYALTAYKRASEQNALTIAFNFGQIAAARHPTIHFMGVWDTVSSMIVPRPDRFYIPSLRTLPYTRTNPSVEVFRHAMAIDERRRMFRLNRWTEPQDFVANRFAVPPAAVPQDIEQRWFAGVHADIGGGYPEVESGLSKFPLIWMVEEAEKNGLLINRTMFDHLARGTPRPGGQHNYVAPDAKGQLHRSLSGAWWILEWLPKNLKWREWPKRRAFLGRYLPRGEPRVVGPNANLDPSVAIRLQSGSYSPINL